MRHHWFRLIVFAAALALGIASSGVQSRQQLTQPPPTVPVAPAEKCAPVETEIRDDNTLVENRYYNYNFGFSVDLPAGMVGVRQSPPTPQHGFGVDLDNPQSTLWAKQPGFPKSYLYIDGSYNSAMWAASFDNAVQDRLDFITRQGGAEVTLLSKAATRLAGLRAVRYVARYKAGDEVMINDVTLAYRNENDQDVIYMIVFDTPLSNYERDKSVVAELLKTWCLQPLP